jgi:peroxiredoxin
MTSASASGHLGILGQRAPELNLNNWIDAGGKKMPSIRLSDYRGKVIYLYFFQDW